MTIFKKADTTETPTLDLSAVKTVLEYGMNQHKVFKSAHEVISILESWENATKDTKKRLDNLNAVYTSTEAQVDDAKATLAMVLREADDVRALAAADADKIRTDAAKDAAALIAAKLAPLEADADQLTADISLLREEQAALMQTNSELKEANSSLAAHIDSIKKSLGV